MKKYRSLLAVLFIATLFVSGCKKTNTEVPELVEPVNSGIDSMPVVITDVYELQVFQAEVIPDLLELTATEDGTIDKILVRVGDSVSKGDLLVSFNSGKTEQYNRLVEQLADMQESNAYNNKIAEINIQISKLSGGDTSYQEMELKQSKERQALEEKHLKSQIEAMLDSGTEIGVVAPCDGVVVSFGQNTAGGNFSEGAPLVVLADESKMYISTEYVEKKVIEDSHACYAIVGDKQYDLTLGYYTNVEGQKHMTRFEFENDGSKFGDYAYVYVVSNFKEKVTAVPVNSLYEEDGNKYVYVVQDNARIKTPVEVGISGAMYVEIISGVKEGENVYVQN